MADEADLQRMIRTQVRAKTAKAFLLVFMGVFAATSLLGLVALLTKLRTFGGFYYFALRTLPIAVMVAVFVSVIAAVGVWFHESGQVRADKIDRDRASGKQPRLTLPRLTFAGALFGVMRLWVIGIACYGVLDLCFAWYQGADIVARRHEIAVLAAQQAAPPPELHRLNAELAGVEVAARRNDEKRPRTYSRVAIAAVLSSLLLAWLAVRTDSQAPGQLNSNGPQS